MLLVLLGAVAGWPILMRILWLVIPRSVDPRTISLVTDGIDSLLKLLAFIFFAVWIYGVFKRLRQGGMQTKCSPGWAVGWWFIPFANVVMPMLVVKEAWTFLTRKGAGLVFGWWALYLLATLLQMGWTGLTRSDLGYDPTTAIVFTVVGWLITVVQIAAYGLWALIVKTMSDAERAPAAAAGPMAAVPGTPAPGAPPI